MKYFTRAWHSGDLPDDECDAIRIAYWQYIDSILPLMPAEIQELTTNTNIHDAEIEYAVVDNTLSELRFGLLCGGVVNSYFKLALVYSGVEVDNACLAEVCADPKREALYDETAVLSNGRFVHSILFWPEYKEIDITYANLSISKEAIEGYAFTPREPVFQVVG